MKNVIDNMAALCWQSAHVARLAASIGENAQLRGRQPTWSALAELRDQLAKMDLRREEIERWLDSYDVEDDDEASEP